MAASIERTVYQIHLYLFRNRMKGITVAVMSDIMSDPKNNKEL